MKIAPLFMAAALALGLLGGCAGDRRSAPESVGEQMSRGRALPPAAAAQITDVDPAIWLLSDDDTRIYLFGTVHMLPPRLGWFDEAVRDAYEASDALILEIVFPPREELEALMLDIGVARDGIALRDRLNEVQLAQYEALMRRLGLPVTMLDAYKPWAAFVTLYQLVLMDGGFDSAEGIEQALTKAAEMDGKPVLGLETAEQQFRIFDGLSQHEQLALLGDLLAAPKDAKTQLEHIVSYWKKGDIAGLDEYLGSSAEAGETQQALITTRNEDWVRQIEARLEEPGTFFLAVGSAHLAGPGNVRALLAEQGLTARRIEY